MLTAKRTSSTHEVGVVLTQLRIEPNEKTAPKVTKEEKMATNSRRRKRTRMRRYQSSLFVILSLIKGGNIKLQPAKQNCLFLYFPTRYPLFTNSFFVKAPISNRRKQHYHGLVSLFNVPFNFLEIVKRLLKNPLFIKFGSEL